MKCSVCGKFRKPEECVEMEGDSSDGYQGERWIECIDCVSDADLEQYFRGYKPKEAARE